MVPPDLVFVIPKSTDCAFLPRFGGFGTGPRWGSGRGARRRSLPSRPYGGGKA